MELYNEYVNKGEAPAIRVNNQSNTTAMYQAEESMEKLPSMYGDIDQTKLHEIHSNPYTLMSAGYEARKEEAKNKAGDVTNFAGEKVNHNLSPLEQMSLAYNPNGTAKNQETNINPNDIKGGENND